MLEFGNKTFTVDGITVFSDHANPNQFWYLPGPVKLARRPEDNRAAFTFIKYGRVVGDQVKGKGFLMFEVNLRLDPRTKRKILSKAQSLSDGEPILSAVPFDGGTVECMALDLQGGGKIEAAVTPEGTFQAVEKILGATVPSLHGDNSAAFSLTLSQDGATILEQVMEEEGMPIGAIYTLTYTGLRPALDVKITANRKRIYDHFSANLEGQYKIIRAGIEAGFEKLVDDGIIKIDVINYSTAADKATQETWALNFFKDKLIGEWFKPTLTPGKLGGGLADAENLQTVVETEKKAKPPTPKEPDTNEKTVVTKPVAHSDTQSGAKEGKFKVSSPDLIKNVAKTLVAPILSSIKADKKDTGVKVPTSSRPSESNNPANSAVVSFKLKYIKQIEDKNVTLHYKRREAIQRTYAPQGFIGLLAKDLSRDGHFFEIDGDDPFFREFLVTVETKFDLNKIGLSSAHVQLEYGDEGHENLKWKDFIIEEKSKDIEEWLVKLDPGRTNYRYYVQYHFDTDSDWEGDSYDYDMPKITTEDRTLLIHPFDILGFFDIEISAEQIDWEAVVNVEVKIEYQPAEGDNKTKNVYFSNSSPKKKNWKLRLNELSMNLLLYTTIYTLETGEKITIDNQVAEGTKILVDNPLTKLEIEFLPLFPPDEIRMVYIDVEYEDITNNYTFSDRVKLNGDSTKSEIVNLYLRDDSQEIFSYRFTFIDKENKLKRGSFITTNETLIGVDII